LSSEVQHHEVIARPFTQRSQAIEDAGDVQFTRPGGPLNRFGERSGREKIGLEHENIFQAHPGRVVNPTILIFCTLTGDGTLPAGEVPSTAIM
jgi:hypothetical protein